jgi:hypothetical protein
MGCHRGDNRGGRRIHPATCARIDDRARELRLFGRRQNADTERESGRLSRLRVSSHLIRSSTWGLLGERASGAPHVRMTFALAQEVWHRQWTPQIG